MLLIPSLLSLLLLSSFLFPSESFVELTQDDEWGRADVKLCQPLAPLPAGERRNRSVLMVDAAHEGYEHGRLSFQQLQHLHKLLRSLARNDFCIVDRREESVEVPSLLVHHSIPFTRALVGSVSVYSCNVPEGSLLPPHSPTPSTSTHTLLPSLFASAKTTTRRKQEEAESVEEDEGKEEKKGKIDKGTGGNKLTCKYRKSCYESGRLPEVLNPAHTPTEDHLTSHSPSSHIEQSRELRCKYRKSCYESGHLPEQLHPPHKETEQEDRTSHSQPSSIQQSHELKCKYRKSCYESGQLPPMHTATLQLPSYSSFFHSADEQGKKKKEKVELEDLSDSEKKMQCKYRKSCYESGQLPEIQPTFHAHSASDALPHEDGQGADVSGSGQKLRCKYRKSCYHPQHTETSEDVQEPPVKRAERKTTVDGRKKKEKEEREEKEEKKEEKERKEDAAEKISKKKTTAKKGEKEEGEAEDTKKAKKRVERDAKEKSNTKAEGIVEKKASKAPKLSKTEVVEEEDLVAETKEKHEELHISDGKRKKGRREEEKKEEDPKEAKGEKDRQQCKYRKSCYESGQLPEITPIFASLATSGEKRGNDAPVEEDFHEMEEKQQKHFCKYRKSCYETGERPHVEGTESYDVFSWTPSGSLPPLTHVSDIHQSRELKCKYRKSCYESGHLPHIRSFQYPALSLLSLTSNHEQPERKRSAKEFEDMRDEERKLFCKYRKSCYESGDVPATESAVWWGSAAGGEEGGDEDGEERAVDTKWKCKYRKTCIEKLQRADKWSEKRLKKEEKMVKREEKKAEQDGGGQRGKTSAHSTLNVPVQVEEKSSAEKEHQQSEEDEEPKEKEEKEEQRKEETEEDSHEDDGEKLTRVHATLKSAQKKKANKKKIEEEEEEKEPAKEPTKKTPKKRKAAEEEIESVKVEVVEMDKERKASHCKYRKSCYSSGVKPVIEENTKSILARLAEAAEKEYSTSEEEDDSQEEGLSERRKLRCKYRKSCYESGKLPKVLHQVHTHVQKEEEEREAVWDDKKLQCKYRKSCYESGKLPKVLHQIHTHAQKEEEGREAVWDDEKLRCKYRKSCYESGQLPEQLHPLHHTHVQDAAAPVWTDEKLLCKYRKSCYAQHQISADSIPANEEKAAEKKPKEKRDEEKDNIAPTKHSKLKEPKKRLDAEKKPEEREAKKQKAVPVKTSKKTEEREEKIIEEAEQAVKVEEKVEEQRPRTPLVIEIDKSLWSVEEKLDCKYRPSCYAGERRKVAQATHAPPTQTRAPIPSSSSPARCHKYLLSCREALGLPPKEKVPVGKNGRKLCRKKKDN